MMGQITSQDLMRAYDAAISEERNLDSFPHLKGKTRDQIKDAMDKYDQYLKHYGTT